MDDASATLQAEPETVASGDRAELRVCTAEIAQLAGGLAHEIRNPLSTMRLNLDLLAEDFRGSTDLRDQRALKKIDRVRVESVRLERLLEDFLRFVGLQDLPLEPTDLNLVVYVMRDFLEGRALAAGVLIRVQYDELLPNVLLHVEMFKQSLLNLTLNALHAMPDGGELILTTREEGEFAVLDVTDTGAGIPSDIQAKVFEPFFSTRSGGSGLGLPICRKIIEAHGGALTLQSEPGKGSRFSIRLPLAPETDRR